MKNVQNALLILIAVLIACFGTLLGVMLLAKGHDVLGGAAFGASIGLAFYAGVDFGKLK